MLANVVGVPIGAFAVPLALLVYGVGALIGSSLGGRLGPARPCGVLFSATATFLVLVGLALLSRSLAATVVLVFLRARSARPR